MLVLVAAGVIFSCCLGTLSCGMWDLVPWPRIEPRPLALGAWSPSHCTTREVPPCFFWAWYKSGTHQQGSCWPVESQVDVCESIITEVVLSFVVEAGVCSSSEAEEVRVLFPGCWEWRWPTAFSEVLLPGLLSVQDCLHPPPKIMLSPWKQNSPNDWLFRE